MPSARRKKILRITVGVVAAACLYLLFQAWSIHHFGFRDDGRHADCAIVLGAAAWHNKPSPVFRERINHAITLYKKGRVPHIILTGGFGEGAPFAESEVALEYCINEGIPKSAISIETTSRTTLQNVTEAKILLDARAGHSALVVSDPWHLKRATTMARRLGIDAHPSGTPSTRFESPKARLHFILRELYFYHEFLLLGR
jgi:uncharacterized SAM-binding protein YcdF (DUF218 family)